MTDTQQPDRSRARARHHTLYRIRNADGSLLYVGISTSSMRRFGEHENATWWSEVATIEVTHLGVIERWRAERIEREVISTERPLYNVTGRAGSAVTSADPFVCATCGLRVVRGGLVLMRGVEAARTDPAGAFRRLLAGELNGSWVAHHFGRRCTPSSGPEDFSIGSEEAHQIFEEMFPHR